MPDRAYEGTIRMIRIRSGGAPFRPRGGRGQRAPTIRGYGDCFPWCFPPPGASPRSPGRSPARPTSRRASASGSSPASSSSRSAPGLCSASGAELSRELRRVREVAHAAQRVLLRPLPPRLDGLALAAGQLSVSRGAAVGGDLYEAVATPYGVRIVIGDVRGHGLPAIGAVAAVLGSFREAAHDEPELGGVLRRLDRAIAAASAGAGPGRASGGRRGRAATARRRRSSSPYCCWRSGTDGGVLALNCGHPWPYRLGRRARSRSPAADPLPPLGLFRSPPSCPCTGVRGCCPGEALFLHTDGAADARDASGKFFGLEAVLAECRARLAGLARRRDRHRSLAVAAAHRRAARRRCGAAGAAQRPLAGAGAVRGHRPAPYPAGTLQSLAVSAAMCSDRQPRDCRAAGAARPAAECRADQQGRRRDRGPPHCTRGSRRPGRLCERHFSQPARAARRQSARGTDRGTRFTPRANRPPLR